MKAWEQFFQSRSINAETPALAALHNAYGGNAKVMDIVSSAVLEDLSGDVEAYWRANRFFRKVLKANLVTQPRVINVDKNAAYPVAIERLKSKQTLAIQIELRRMKY